MINFSKNKLNEIKSLPIPAIIAISGYGGSGKSTAAELLSKELNAPIISIDYFFTDKNDYSNWDIIDFSRFKNEVIEPFYNNPNDEEWEGIWKRNDLEYFEKYCPKDLADLIVNNV